MSITKYAVSRWNDIPSKKEYSRETDHFYIHIRGRGRDAKISQWEKYFDTESEALEFVAQRNANRVRSKEIDQIKRYAVDLLDSLEAVVAIADRNTDVFITARAVIAKARGEA